MITRRTAIAGALATAPLLKSSGARARPDPRTVIADLERAHGGRLGVAILNTDNTKLIEYRGNEKFAMCSTHKFLAAALVLDRVDRGEEHLDRRVFFNRDSLVTYSPITERHAGTDGMTVGELCEAAITVSDNAAANLLLGTLGGPAAFTAQLRARGDAITRLDRLETALNEASPGDPRDTTTPLAMLVHLRNMAVERALSAASREQLVTWLVGCKTGDKRLRGGIPGWRVGDKTGTGERNTTNDIAVIWPPGGRGAIVVTAYYTQSPAGSDERESVLAKVGELAAAV